MTSPTAPILSGFLADRSPTGRAVALFVTRDGPGKPWTYLPDEGGPRRTVHGPEPLYATPEDAVQAARLRWSCTQGKPRYKSSPVPVDSVF